MNEDMEILDKKSESDNEIEFIEDKSILEPMDSVYKIPEKSIEGWFYKKFPGKYRAKKMILVSIITILYTISLVLVILAKSDF